MAGPVPAPASATTSPTVLSSASAGVLSFFGEFESVAAVDGKVLRLSTLMRDDDCHDWRLTKWWKAKTVMTARATKTRYRRTRSMMEVSDGRRAAPAAAEG